MRALLLVMLSTVAAEAAEGHWWRDHAVAEWMVGTGGWRTGIGVDVRAPGFDAVGGGTEVWLGLELGSGLGIVAGGRFLAGVRGDSGYLEGMGSLALQL